MTTQDFFSLGILHRALGWHSVICNPEHESSSLTPSPHFLLFSRNRKLLSPNAVKSCGLYPCWPRRQSLLWRQKEFIGLIFVDKRLICRVPPLREYGFGRHRVTWRRKEGGGRLRWPGGEYGSQNGRDQSSQYISSLSVFHSPEHPERFTNLNREEKGRGRR